MVVIVIFSRVAAVIAQQGWDLANAVRSRQGIDLLLVGPVLHHRALGNRAVMASQAHYDAAYVAVLLAGPRSGRAARGSSQDVTVGAARVGEIAEVKRL